jgi:hypothetical protein
MRAYHRLGWAIPFCLLALPVSPDVLHLKNGGVLRGRVSEQGDTVTLDAKWGRVVLSRAEVLRIEKEPPAETQYATRRAALKNPTVKDWVELARWCEANDLNSQAREAYTEAVRLDPDHEAARRALGFVWWQDRWVTEDEYHAALGEVRFRDRWMPREEMLSVLEAEKAARGARELADRIERERQEAVAAERRVQEAARAAEVEARRQAEADARRREVALRQDLQATRIDSTWWPPTTYMTGYGGYGGYPYYGGVGWITPSYTPRSWGWNIRIERHSGSRHHRHDR